jgi:hypothetical protein
MTKALSTDIKTIGITIAAAHNAQPINAWAKITTIFFVFISKHLLLKILFD